ncbi:hypothetical protein ACN38_g7999 [Penicillium nordicum]|uniref:Uncharacterized protein n=1 Tax=Penicillium nordicum TaxID=229535 RepID=A0A0M9WDU6_9EURO|nr:hypothetical protein ACN38_g7999 [Penicillium nordicum]
MEGHGGGAVREKSQGTGGWVFFFFFFGVFFFFFLVFFFLLFLSFILLLFFLSSLHIYISCLCYTYTRLYLAIIYYIIYTYEINTFDNLTSYTSKCASGNEPLKKNLRYFLVPRDGEMEETRPI